MQSSIRESYLTSEVMSAAPQKLQLMLVEGAIRSVQRTLDFWQNGQEEEANGTALHAQQIVTEMLCSLNPEADPELVRRMASVYLFLFRTLTAAHLEHSAEKMHDVLKVLDVERETWRQACIKFGSTTTAVTMPMPTTESSGGMSFVA